MDTKVAIPLLTFLLGLWGGHHFSLLRDKRKEYNEVADRMREPLLGEVADNLCLHRSVSRFDLDQLEAMLHWWRRPSFRRAVDRYRAAKGDYRQDSFGGPIQNDVEEARAALDSLISFTKRK